MSPHAAACRKPENCWNEKFPRINVLKKIQKYFTIKALIKLYTKYKETAALRACQRFYVSGSYKRRKLCVYVHLQR